MILRRRKRAGKLILGAICLVVILWIYRGSSPVFLQKPLRDSLVIQGAIQTVHTKVASRRAHQCLSSSRLINVTANFTLNDVLDSMRLKFMHDGIHGESSMTRRTPVAEDVRRLGAADLEVIVIPHSHNDPGWKKTYMKYYQDDTRHILDLIVEKLNLYTDITFVWVESCFLNTWWTNQTMATREKFRKLVKSGRLELVSGMWVAPDEASTHYFALVDQLIEGHYWVKTNLGVTPQTSLNFDQFGYSASMPYLMKASGLSNVLIKRIHRGVKQILGENKWMAFNWRQLWDPQGKHDIFTQVDTYEWMSISDSCGPDRAICRGLDFSVRPNLPDPASSEAHNPFVFDSFTGAQANNFHDFVVKVVGQFKLKSANYPHKVMMLPHGGDFHYSKPDSWKKQYENLKVFMKYVNDHRKEFHVNMRFGTFSDYFSTLEKQVSEYGITYPTVSGDFFTYTESNEYWTGYFTTRQFDKRLSREVLESLRAAEFMSAILFLDKTSQNRLPNEEKNTVLSNLVNARQDLGIFQHHDAITGTSQEHVAKDYEQRLSSAFTASHDALASVVGAFLQRDTASDARPLKSVLVRPGFDKLTENVVVTPNPEGIRLIMLNSFTQPRKEIISVALYSKNVIVLDENGNRVDFDIVPKSEHAVNIMFPVAFPPVSLKVYTIKHSVSNQDEHKPNAHSVSVSETLLGKDDIVCENQYLNITFSKNTGSPERVCHKPVGSCSRLELDWRYYKGHGGAYTMISNGVEVAASDKTPKIQKVDGKTVCEIRQTFDYFTVTHTLYKTTGVLGRALKVSVLSDLTKAAGFNGDLAMRVRTDIGNNKTFYVDSNGMQLMGRRFRESLPFDGNVYPMTSMAFIEDDRARLVVHSAQPHGVTSATSGVLDFMIDRIAMRPEMDMPEPVRDSKPTKTMLFIELQTPEEFQSIKSRETALPSLNSVFLNDIVQHPIYSFISHDIKSESHNSMNFLQEHLPCDVAVANVKNLVREKNETDGVSLTLFRRAVSCSSNKDRDVCVTYDKTDIRPEALFCRRPGCDDVTSREMFASLLKEKKVRGSGSIHGGRVDLNPMDIKTFHVKQKNSIVT